MSQNMIFGQKIGVKPQNQPKINQVGFDSNFQGRPGPINVSPLKGPESWLEGGDLKMRLGSFEVLDLFPA